MACMAQGPSLRKTYFNMRISKVQAYQGVLRKRSYIFVPYSPIMIATMFNTKRDSDRRLHLFDDDKAIATIMESKNLIRIC